MSEQIPGSVAVIGLAWYKRTDYQRIREIMVDGEKLAITFDRWQGPAERFEAEQKRAGRTVVRAYVDPEQFVAWCAETGRDVDAKARTAWANLAARRFARGED